MLRRVEWYIVTKFRMIVLPSSSRLLFEPKDEVSIDTLVTIYQATARSLLEHTNLRKTVREVPTKQHGVTLHRMVTLLAIHNLT